VGNLAQIDENVSRAELNVIEFGEHLLQRDELLEAMGFRKISGNNRFSDRQADYAS
jgi:hypothetical protein